MHHLFGTVSEWCVFEWIIIDGTERILGQETIRMECMCMYHSACLQQWFVKCHDTTCPLHTVDSLQK